MTIALFGGSFNPVHYGHFEIVRQVDLQFDFSKIIVVPAYKNPLKENLPSIPESVRLKMLAETFLEFKNVEISTYELNKQKTSYTYTTLEHFRKQYPQHKLYLILGEDAFASFHLWVNADKIFRLCSMLLFKRKGMKSQLPVNLEKQPASVDWVKAEIPEVSASEIRSSSLKTLTQNKWLHPNAFKTWKEFCENSK